MTLTIDTVAHIPASGGAWLEGLLEAPQPLAGVVVFAHGSGSGRRSPRNRFVASELQRHGFATLLVDLLTEREDAVREARFDIALLADRLAACVRWARTWPFDGKPPIGLFGASTGAAAALAVAADPAARIAAVVSRGGRPDLAGPGVLERVEAPTLLIVGGADSGVIELNALSHARLRCEKALEVVPGATHLFEEPGALETVAALAARWFGRHLGPLHARTEGLVDAR